MISLLNARQSRFVWRLGDTLTTHDEEDLDSHSDKLNDFDMYAQASIFSQSKEKFEQRLFKLYSISKSKHLKVNKGTRLLNECEREDRPEGSQQLNDNSENELRELSNSTIDAD